MTGIFTWLQGKKTYFVAVISWLTAFVAWFDGTMPLGQFIEATIALVLAMTIRAGITKSAPK